MRGGVPLGGRGGACTPLAAGAGAVGAWVTAVLTAGACGAAGSSLEVAGSALLREGAPED